MVTDGQDGKGTGSEGRADGKKPRKARSASRMMALTMQGPEGVAIVGGAWYEVATGNTVEGTKAALPADFTGDFIVVCVRARLTASVKQERVIRAVKG